MVLGHQYPKKEIYNPLNVNSTKDLDKNLNYLQNTLKGMACINFKLTLRNHRIKLTTDSGDLWIYSEQGINYGYLL